MRVLGAVSVVLALSACLNPSGSSSGDDTGLSLPDGGGTLYQPVGNVPIPGNSGTLSISESGGTITVSFAAGTDVETSDSSLQYILYVSSGTDVLRSEDLWYAVEHSLGTIVTYSNSYPGSLSVTLSRLMPVYINIGVRDGDGNVSAYDARYWEPTPSSASYTVQLEAENTTTSDKAQAVSFAASGGDVLYVFTNTNAGSESAVTLDGSNYSVSAPAASVVGTSIPPVAVREPPGIGLRGFPGQHDPAGDPIVGAKPEPGIVTSSLSASTAVGSTSRFYTDTNTSTYVDATAVSTAASGEWNLTVWVDSANDAGITQEMVDTLTSRFMKTGDDNDIFDWVVATYGVPWGTNPYSNVLSGSRRDIHILLYDIDGDGSPAPGEARTVGYFWSKDNFTDSDSSNQRLMFYLDAPLLAAKTGASWQIDDYWPGEVVSTLAHEFQHMVHYYQRRIVHGVFSDTWVNEMSSMAAEELVSRLAAVDGPRGVDHSVGDAGGSGNGYGRIPDWMGAPRTQLDTWSYSNPLPYYGTSYAFGAALMRLYGADVFHQLMSTTSTGRDAVVAAVNATGQSVTFESLLGDWALAMLLSNDTSAGASRRINSGTWISTAANGTSYQIGSLNFHNYVDGGGDGFPIATQTVSVSVPPTASFYVRVAQAATGSYSDSVTIPPGFSFTAVERQ